MATLLVISTASSKQEARKITQRLLKLKLAACVNIVPAIESHYRWKGKKEMSREALLLIKTKDKLYPQLEKAIRSAHSYEVPEIIALRITRGSKNYFAWLEKAMK